MSDKLIFSRKFLPLFVTQGLAAFNDNFLKNTLVFLILFQVVSTGRDPSEAAALITAAGAIFMLPFLLLSALGGELADRFDKAVLSRKLKLAEAGVAILSIMGLYAESVPVLMLSLFGFGVGSALFGPIKYGILPDLLQKEDLPKANAWIEAATFAAILGGTITAGVSFMAGPADPWVFGPMMMAFAVACYAASRFIPNTGSRAPDLQIDPNIFRSTWKLVSEISGERRMIDTAVMSAWFWLVGSIILSLLPAMTQEILGGDEMAITAFLALFAVFVAIGSAAAAWLSSGRIVLLPAPVGALLIGIFGLDLAWSLSSFATASGQLPLSQFAMQPGMWRIALDLAGMAFAGALIVIPTFAALQAWAKESRRARVIAAANVISAALMTFGGAATAAVQAAGASIPMVLSVLALLNLAASAVMIKRLPTSPFRDFVSILFRAFHRLEIKGMENLNKAGETPILALNHVSFLDGPLALALTDKEPVFAINSEIAGRWWVKPFLKLTKAKPLDPTKPMATRTLIKSVEAGNPLVIFPEGRITVTGGLMKVYDGAAMVADKTGSMIVPVRIEGLEKSFFSRLTSMHVRRRLFPKVTCTILEPVTLSIDPELKGRKRRAAAGADLYRVMSDLVFRTSSKESTVFEAVVEAARERGMGRLAVQDPVTGSLSYGKLLAGASVLARKFSSMFRDENTLGVMLPNANGAAATVLGVMSAGKVPAMINFTAGVSNILSSCKAAEVRTILTSRAFVKQAKLESVVEGVKSSVRIVYLDDLRETITSAEKIRGLLGRSKPLVSRKPGDPAVIMFTSGSEGTPKGVVLTHGNVLANAVQAASRIDFHSGDKVFNILPVFHSFGLTAGLILPLVSGVPVFLYPSPLHYRIVPELIYGSNATIVFGTDTFLSGYARTAHPYDLRSIRYCFAGAEPVKKSTREIYMEKFGIRILEGYGVTEASPVISLNTPMYNRSGTVGKILPGMEAKLEPVPGVDEGGRLYVRGPNIMQGYLRAENPGVVEPLPDGWHDTGDIVTIDGDGFITIKGRAKRFAKIGGEMISLAAVEALAGEIWPDTLSAVAAVKDDRKGERLVLYTEAEGADRAKFLKHAKGKGVPELMVPSEIVTCKVPVLGSGKIDFVSVGRLANERRDKSAA